MSSNIDLKLVTERAGEHVYISLFILPILLPYYSKLGMNLLMSKIEETENAKIVAYYSDKPYVTAIVPADHDVVPPPREEGKDNIEIKVLTSRMLQMLDRLCSLLTLMREVPITIEPVEDMDDGCLCCICLDLLEGEPRYIPLMFMIMLGVSCEDVNNIVLESTYSSLLVEYVKKGETVLEQYDIPENLKNKLISDARMFRTLRENAKRELERYLSCISQS